MKTRLAIVFTLAVLAGCATSGNDFNFEGRKSLAVDRTTVNDAIDLLGEPSSRQTASTKDSNYEIMQHVYASADPSGASSRVSTLEFKDGVLNAKAYTSGFEEDSTAFKIENVDQINIDSTTADEAVRLLGEPSGSGNCPSAIEPNAKLCDDDNASSILSWSYVAKTEGLGGLPVVKEVGLAVNEEGVVVGIQAAS